MTLLHRTCMDNKMYPRKAYNMLLNIQKQNYTTCACSGRNVLYKFDFGFVWEMQGVGDVKSFIKEFKQRPIDCLQQDWHSALKPHDFYNVHSNLRRSLVVSLYLCLLSNVSVRRVFAKFKTGIPALKFNCLQYRPVVLDSDTYCSFCKDTPETEVYFLLACRKYKP